MKLKFIKSAFFSLFFCSLFFACATFVKAQKISSLQRGQVKDMLKTVKGKIKDEYFDTTYKGVDLDAKFKAAEEKLDAATTLGQAYGIVAQAVLELNDSHTKFYPPSPTPVEYGWRMKMIGDKCFVIAVKPKSDAEKQGLKPGDQILSIEGFRPNRKEMWKINYYYRTLSPRTRLAVTVQSPNEKSPRELIIASKVYPLKPFQDLEDIIRQFEIGGGGETHRFQKVSDTVIWQMPSFIIEPEQIDGIMQDRINKNQNVIFDLRGNGGGYVVALERLAGYFVDKDTKIADLKGRKEMKPQIAKTRGKDVFRGKVIVLVDSESGSAAEIFARFMQIEQRGVVLGDQSAGAVMQSLPVSLKMITGEESFIPYYMNLTNADVITTDGKSLEHIGVTPNLVLIPTGADLAAQRDPVLAAALELLGTKISPAEAGKFFPFEWEKE